MLRQVLRRLWVRVGAFAALAIGSAVAAPILSPLVPSEWADALGGEAVDQVLNILASSMLAVTTFSLSIAVNAYTAAESTSTPRAIALLQEDLTTQRTLATFLGAFVYSIVAIIGLNASYYDNGGRVVLFGVTILVVAIVVFALLRWISYLPDFGRMNNTLDRVEEAARNALKTRLDTPFLGGHPAGDIVPDGANIVEARLTGYVQHIDMGKLNTWAEENGAKIWLAVLPGDFVYSHAPLLHVLGADPGEADCQLLCDMVTVARRRSFDQDPRFGMITFAEIASRALSPGINDPGTAIAVIDRQLSVLTEWRMREGPEVDFDAIHVPSVEPGDMLDSAFRPIARDGAGHSEVVVRLILALKALARIGPDAYGDAADRLIDEIEAHSVAADLIAQDRARIDDARR
ncbi:DUF2254 domain-containing protein [Rhodobacterales bacterium HKCCE4037]|nr:DUF2254 domain-containing protein [Rhodobacterales bacterium HKCCE4037]